jgi:multiple sugar transport system ATP-binding protein
MRTEISRIQQQLKTTMIYVTHDQTEAMTLGDRIAVMRSGLLQQVGPPSELYAHPKNLFVAGFIGSPSMNFLPGELEGDKVRLPIGDVALPDELRRKLESSTGGRGRSVIVGLRPEDFEDVALVNDRSAGTTFKTKIDVLESMGSEYYAYFVVESERVSSKELEELAQDAGSADLPHSHEGSQVVARLGAASKARQGEQLELWFNSWHLHLFDTETGQSLLTGDADGATDATASPQPPATEAATTTPEPSAESS